MFRNLSDPGSLEGGSTLTQQLARTLFLSNRKTYGRKLHEAVLAVMIDAQLSKDQVLELYLNRIYLSAGVYGVETMSRHLFGKPAKQLTLAESALIAGLARAPAALSPWNHLDDAVARSHVVLARMRDEGFITARAGAGGAACPHPRATLSRRRRVAQAGYAKDYLRQQFRDHFGGDHPPDWEVRTTFVPELQEMAERAVSDGLRRFGDARSAGRAGRDRSRHRRHPRHGRRARLPAVAVQPRQPQPPPARIGVQAAALRGGPRARLLAGVGALGSRARAAAGTRGVVAAQRRGGRARRR